jgi:hypothetical protein
MRFRTEFSPDYTGHAIWRRRRGQAAVGLHDPTFSHHVKQPLEMRAWSMPAFTKNKFLIFIFSNFSGKN